MQQTGATKERLLREGALVDAEMLHREHGEAAINLLTARAAVSGLPAEDRRRARLTRLEVERLVRVARQSNYRGLTIWKPPLFSLAGMAALFGMGPRFRRRR